jgi:hypothetical protein
MLTGKKVKIKHRYKLDLAAWRGVGQQDLPGATVRAESQ